MKGSIRAIVGFLIVFGAVGSIETSMDNGALLAGIVVAALGLGLMASGTKALNTYQ